MVRPQASWMAVVAGAMALLTSPPGLGQDFAEVVVKSGQIDGNLVTGGETVTVNGQVDGDVVAIGETVVIGGRVSQDILAAGGDVVVGGTIDGDVRIVGAELTPAATIGGDLMAATETIMVPAETTIGGNAWLAGREAQLSGAVAGDLRIAAREIRIAGAVGRDAELVGETITIASTARIAGDLVYRSVAEASIEPGAEILGDVIFIRSEAPRRLIGDALASISAFSLLFLLGLFLLGVLQILVFPDTATGPSMRLGHRPWPALGLGCLILFGCPIVIVLLAISVVGIPVMIVLGASYVIALFVGFLVAAGALGRRGARLIGRDPESSFWTRVTALAVGLLLLAIVGLIPVLGPLIVLLAMAAGLGALALQVRNARPSAAS